MKKTETDKQNFGTFNLESRRYIGNKTKLMNWVKDIMSENTKGNSLFDVFAGTGAVSKALLESYDEIILNDFLYSNEVIYKAFFDNEQYDKEKLLEIESKYQRITTNEIDDEYFVSNYGNKYFSEFDARIIGEIREDIERRTNLNEKEKSILIASLVYSADKCSNTVGHYDAYRKINNIEDKFIFKLINPLDTELKRIKIFRDDSNTLVRNIKADVAFIDPPYNSRQYSRFYHLLEVLVKWEKPRLEGVAMKPPTENVSEYSKTSAHKVFEDLIRNINVNYIAVIYNNTYTSKSSSSKNKITHDQILETLNKKGKTKVFEKKHKFFNSGKTQFIDHKEFLFITEVSQIEKN